MMKVALKAFEKKKAEWKEREKETRDSVQGALGDFFVKGNRLRHARVFSKVESQSKLCVYIHVKSERGRGGERKGYIYT